MVTYRFKADEIPGCQDWMLTDITGVYDVDANRGGFDDGSFTSLNVAISDITSVLLTVRMPDGTSRNIGIITGGNFPGIGTIPYFRITPVMLGLAADAKKPDGLYTMRVQITCDTFQGTPLDSPLIFFSDITVIALCQGYCCLANLATKLKAVKKCWNCKESNLVLTVYGLLAKSRWAMNCPDSAIAEELRLEAQEICTTNNCNC